MRRSTGKAANNPDTIIRLYKCNMLDNPYETPRVEAFQEAPSSDSELEKRVAALEKLVAESWFLRRHTGYRIAAVWSYFLLGYAIVAAVAMPFVLVFEMIFP
jgi:hypothetical protein